MTDINPDDFIITRKRKLYKFAVFQTLANCYDDKAWTDGKAKVLADERPLTVEVGAGSAIFSTKLAQNHPDRQFLAIDRKSDRLQKGAKLATELKLDNIVYLWSNASSIRSLLPAGTASEIWITFPDPWPQESNIKHRLTNPKFLAQYHKLLQLGGVLNFKTDNLPLFDWSVEQFGQDWQVTYITRNLHDPTIVSEVDTDALVMTTYEERYVNEGKRINYLKASTK